ncbi:MAG: riboflavin biosynthesis protein RibF [Bacteroidales bacterium]|nr:riboflavin biosynthesis protein RibF [Bacteroidales bacterium]
MMNKFQDIHAFAIFAIVIVIQLETYYGHSGLKGNKPVVTVGMFDGVHRGHRVLIDHLREKANSIGGESVVITLEPHPGLVLSENQSSIRFLTSLEEKEKLLGRAGIDKLYVIPFSRSFSRLPACDFVKYYLVERLRIEHLILGFDHHFGYRGYGNKDTITECANKYGFGVDRMDALREGDEIISSSSIRNYLSSGRLHEANKLLGYRYTVSGSVVRGKRIGRLLGYPTANIVPGYKYKLIPADGVYAVKVSLDSKVYNAMLYIGPRPTIEKEKGERTIEVNIFEFNSDIYNKELRVEFHYMLRPDMRFSSRHDLIKQIEKDKAESLRLLGE